MIFLVLSLICFILSAFGVTTGKINVMALGLTFLVCSMLFKV